MKTTRTITTATALCLAFAVAACEQEPVQRTQKHTEPQAAAAPKGFEVDSAKLSLYAVLPDKAASSSNLSSDEKVSLGHLLFDEPRLSKAQDVACSTCHDPSKSGADGTDFSLGHGKKKLGRNTPTVFNSAVAASQFWDGRAETIEDAAKMVLLDPAVMASTEARVVDTLKSMPEYVDAFKKAYPDAPDPVTLTNATNALGDYMRKLLTPSRWDKFMKGDKAAITDDEKKGFTKFVDVGCPTCHVGPLVGATMFQKLGKEKPWPNQADKGRAAVTKSPSDDMMFKVSSLRNVEHTAPYFHDASGKSLEEAVKTMASYQLNKDLPDDDVKLIVAWLKTLSGDLPADLAKKSAPFPSTAKTPKPDKK
jgi:cytochrome c peroxidase